jgi:uncharacterized delta-60 repeat protein
LGSYWSSGKSVAQASKHSIAVQSDGKVLIGGGFTEVNGIGRTNLARFNPDGTFDHDFQVDFTVLSTSICLFPHGVVYSITVQNDSKLLIGGNFSTVNGVNRHNLARLNADGTLDPSFLDGLSGTDAFSYVYSLALQNDGRILLGGDFSEGEPLSPRLAQQFTHRRFGSLECFTQFRDVRDHHFGQRCFKLL